MSKARVAEIVKLIQSGQFFAAFDLINVSTLSSDWLLHVLVAVSRYCHHTPENCEAEYLEKFCSHICKSIADLDSTQLNLYYRSAYHIIKFICNKERIDVLAKLKSVIIPKFLHKSSLCDGPVQSTYISLIQLISRTTSQLANTENTTLNNDFMQVVRIELEAHCKLNNVESMLNQVLTCYKQYKTLGATGEQMLSFYNTVLELIGLNFSEMIEYTEYTQTILLEIYSNIFRESLQTNNFELFNLSIRVVEQNFSQDYLDSFSMFEAVSALYPVNLQELDKQIKTINQLCIMFKTRNKNAFLVALNYVSRPLQELLLYYKNSGSQTWINLPQKIILNVLKLFKNWTFHCLSIKSPAEHPLESCKCLMCQVHIAAFRIGCHVTDLLRSYTRTQCNNVDKHFFAAVILWLNYFFDWLKEMKGAKWQYWSSFYSEFSAYAYNIGVVLFNDKCPGHTLINRCLLKHIIEIEGSKPKVRSHKNIAFLFTSIADEQFMNENFIGGLGVAALHCLLYPEESESLIRHEWIMKKTKMNDCLKQLTMVDILHRQYNELKDILDYQPLLTPDKKTELLILELTKYKQHWKNRASMMSCFEQLVEIADIPTLSDVLVQVYGEGDILMRNEMLAIMLRAKSKFENYLSSCTDSKVQLAFAVLNYYLFEVSFINKADKNLEEMEMTMRVVESAKEKKDIDVVPKDANDECDIVSAYSNLRLSDFLNVLKFLDTSREILCSLTEDEFDVNVFKTVAKLLFAVSLKYRLHNLTVANLQCCFMSMKWAEKSGDSELILLNLSRLIECGDIQKDYIKSLVDTGDRMAEKLQNDNSDGKYNKVLTIYNISKSKLLLHEAPEEAYKAWKIADSICSLSNGNIKLKILKAELYVVLYKLTKNCNFIPGEHEREPMTLKLHCASDVVLEYIKSHHPDSFALSITLDTMYEVAQAYKLMRLPRDLRAYCKEIVLLAQKLVLPLRLVPLLICLGYSDVTTGLLDHCRVKLNGIDDILSLNHTSAYEVPYKLELDEKVVENDIEKCTDMIQELVLDVPEHFRQYHPSSPTLAVETFKLPPFLSHCKSCLCLMCRSTEFQRLLLQKYHLSALANMYEKDDKVAEEFVAGAVKMYDYLNSNYGNYRSKVGRLLPVALIPDFDDLFLESYTYILYDYSYHMSRKGLKDEAMIINARLLKTLKTKQIRYVHLYEDLVMQKVSYLMVKKMEKENVQSELKSLDLATAVSPNIPKTPTRNNLVPLKISVNDLPVYSPIRRKPRKCKLFDSNDIDVNSPAEVLKSTRKKKPKIPSSEEELLKPKGKISSSIPVDTPKIAIFSDVEPKTRTTTRKTKTSKPPSSENEVLAVTPPKSKPIKKQPTTQSLGAGDSLNSMQKVPVTSETSTKKTRSQLLTQKIKESSKLKEELFKNKALLPDKIVIKEQNSHENSSLIPESPENRDAVAKSAEFMEKLMTSVKKSAKVKKENIDKNLLPVCESNGSSSSTTGAVRKSARVCKRIF